MHVFLVGPPGVGKSTIAPLLAARLGARAIELDAEIERAAGKSCRDVIEIDGWDRFRDVESEAITRMRPSPSWTVIDAGGGAVIRASNRSAMRSLGTVVGLKGSLAHITRGIAATMAKRPYGDLPAPERARRVLRERRVAYADADEMFPVDGASPEQVADRIAAWLVDVRGVRLDVVAAHPYAVVVRTGLYEEVGERLRDLGWTGKAVVVADAEGTRLFAPTVAASLRKAGLSSALVRVGRGERAKSARSLARLWSDLARAGLGRDGGVIALGGGVVGDLAGFAAATYARGVRLAHLPTTLLAMVDSSIGGKTGIDLPEGKNLAGAFHAPDVTLADLSSLRTLPRRQMSAGLAEVIKSAFIADRQSVAQLERSIGDVRGGRLPATLAAVAMAVSVKADIVGRDERESGLREVLNFGHTFGHAYEAATSYRVLHGEAVGLGMVFACALAEQLDLAPASLRETVERLLRAAGLPLRAAVPSETWAYLGRDKKARAGSVRWVLPRRVGRFSEVTDVRPVALRGAARALAGGATGRDGQAA